MNYRHHFHAGNFADVVKHVLLVQLLRGFQRKGKGYLFLDTHAGRGRYDLAEATSGDSLSRTPEHPAGIGRLWNDPTEASPIREYLELVRGFDRENGNDGIIPRYYPGSPWLGRTLARLQDRVALCEKQPDEFEALAAEFSGERQVSVHLLDGYTSVRAMLPPLEKRALILVDPPFEEKEEFSRIVGALEAGLRRMPAATFAVWYPLTERAKADNFLEELMSLELPPTWIAEVMVAGALSPIKMKGCGLAVVNPPWQIEQTVGPTLALLAARLSQAPGGGSSLRWLVQER